MNIFKMNYGHVIEKVDYLIDHNYLQQDENYVYRLTPKGIDILKESGFENINIIDILGEASDENVTMPIKTFEKNIVYIPIDFDKKFNGY